MNFHIRMAELLVCIEHEHQEVKKRCRDYIVEPEREPDLTVRADPEYLKIARKWFEDEGTLNTFDDPEGYVEYDALSHEINPRLPAVDALWLHASVVELDGEGIAFTAPSGYGKSTQTQLWLKEFGDRIRIINGDNPILRCRDGRVYAYGTPFCGKEGFNINTGVPLKAICVLEHSDVTEVLPVKPMVAFARLMRDSNALFDWPVDRQKLLDLWEYVVQTVPVYRLRCTLDENTARLAYAAIKEGCPDLALPAAANRGG